MENSNQLIMDPSYFFLQLIKLLFALWPFVARTVPAPVFHLVFP